MIIECSKSMYENTWWYGVCVHCCSSKSVLRRCVSQLLLALIVAWPLGGAYQSVVQWSSTWAKSPPRGRFYALWGRFC